MRNEKDIGTEELSSAQDELQRRVAELEASQRRFRATLDGMGDGVIATDAEGRIVQMNPVAEDLTGWREDEAEGMPADEVFRVIDEETRDAVDGLIGRVLREASVVGLGRPSLLMARNGRECPIDDSASPILDEEGTLTGVVLVFRDRTAQRRAEEREAHIKQVLLAIRNVNQLIVQETERARLIEKACANLTETMGYQNAWIALLDETKTAASMTGASGFDGGFEAMQIRLARGEFPACMRRALEADASVVVEAPVVECADCPLSRKYAGRAGLCHRLSYKNKVYGVLAVSVPAPYAYDAEEQSLFEEVAGDLGFALSKIEDAAALRESQEFVRSTIDSLSAHVCVLDADGVILAVNQAWRDFAEANPPLRGNVNEGVNYLAVCDEAEGQDADIARRFAEGIRAVRRGDCDRFRLEYPCHSPGEHRWFVGHVTRFAGERKGRVVIAHENITERVLAERALRRANDIITRSPAVAFVWRNEEGWPVEYVSENVQSLLGWSAEDFMSGAVSYSRVVHPDDVARVTEEVAQATDRPDAQTLTHAPYRIVTRDGEVKWVDDRTTIRRAEDGSVVGYEGILLDVTDRKRAEEALRANEEKYRSVLEHIEEGYYEVDLAGNFTFFNDSTCRILGYSPDELMGMNNRQYMDEGNAKIVYRTFNEVYRTGVPAQSFDWQLIRKDGSPCFVETSVSLMRDAQGQPIGFRGIFRDITERKRAEEALRESERLLRKSQEVARLGSWQLDLREDRLFWSDEVYRIFGLDANEFRATYEAFLEAVHPDDRAVVHAAYRDSYRQGKDTYEIEHRVVRRDTGETRWVHEKCEHIRDDTGEVIRSVGMVQDITERKRAEQALVESEQRYRTVAENFPNGAIFLIDRELRYVFADGRALTDIGLSKRDLIGKTAYEVFPPEVTDVAGAQAPRVFDGEHVQYEVTFQGRIYDNWGVPIVQDDGEIQHGVVITIDITERKLAEQERQRIEERLREAQKLESLGILAGGIAHDFNNLLVGILGNASLAMMDLSIESPARNPIEMIETSAMRAADLTNQMLAYSGRGAFVIEQVELSHLVQEMSHLVEPGISKKIIVNHDLAWDLPPVEGDATQLRQVVMNLITNAAEAIGDAEGMITVRTGLLYADNDLLTQTHPPESLPEGHYAFLEVADTGCGMDEETKSRVFDPFFTTKFTGRGLGMAAVLGIVRGHQGTVQVDSEVGRGSTFRVLLPIAPDGPPEPAEERRLSGIESKTVPSGRVLVVDDEEQVLHVARKALERAGHEVVQARNGREAVDVFQRSPEAFSVVVLDLTMPEMDGEETLDALRGIRPNVPVILSSGYSLQEATTRFAGKDLSAFVHKPYRIQELIDTVRDVLGG